ncbi:hypothetical protein QAD02_010210 [Eretmocerus hayati]|uniref:Uncharacterized protein n=1 Tax=Eretmocerus hayati TaxID=131215 RepID=A0ACC2NE40_9HYME|nr:hypothetical protein QAD02_010210 [Eretmocerus hayati]
MSLLTECYRRLTDRSSSDIPLRGYKVTDVNRTRKVGIACRSLDELKQKACEKFDVTDDLDEIGIFLIDGSEIDDDYFATLEPQTLLILRKPGEVILTDADILYQMLRKANDQLLRDGEKASEYFSGKLKERIEKLNKVLSKDDSKVLSSRREDHPEWFDGLETNAQTKEAYLHRRCQDRIRGYLYKTIEQIRSSETYDDVKARKQLQRVIVYFKQQLRQDHFFGYYFDRNCAVQPKDSDESSTDDETDSAKRCPYDDCPCKMDDSIYEQYILGLDDVEDDDEVDAKRIPAASPEKKRKVDESRQEVEKREFLEAEKECTFKITDRKRAEKIALCDSKGEFQCRGVWNRDSCFYEDKHRINPYRSKEELVFFSTWNLDHKIERSRTLVPQLLEAAKKGNIDQKFATELYENLFTAKNLRIVHIVCHDKGSHK